MGLGGFEFGSGSKQPSQYSALTEMENAVNALYSTKPQTNSRKSSLTTTTASQNDVSSSLSSNTSIQNQGNSVINLTSPANTNSNSAIESSTEVQPTQNRGQASSRTVSPAGPMPSTQDLRTRIAEAAIRRATGWNNMSSRANSEVIIPPPFHGFENITETNSQSEHASKRESDVVVMLDTDDEIESDDEVQFVCTQKETRVVQDEVFELDV